MSTRCVPCLSDPVQHLSIKKNKKRGKENSLSTKDNKVDALLNSEFSSIFMPLFN
jgi:hypothetical protein